MLSCLDGPLQSDFSVNIVKGDKKGSLNELNSSTYVVCKWTTFSIEDKGSGMLSVMMRRWWENLFPHYSHLFDKGQKILSLSQYNHRIYCHIPAGWGLQQTTRAPGSKKTWGQRSFGPFTGGLTSPTQKFKKEERTVHWTHFTKAGWTWHVTIYTLAVCGHKKGVAQSSKSRYMIMTAGFPAEFRNKIPWLCWYRSASCPILYYRCSNPLIIVRLNDQGVLPDMHEITKNVSSMPYTISVLTPRSSCDCTIKALVSYMPVAFKSS